MPARFKVIRSSLSVNRKKQDLLTMNNERKTTNQKGFTLIELMVAIAIIAILAAVGLVVYSTAQKSARNSRRLQDLQALKTALEVYKSSTGSYPNQNVASSCTNYSTALGVLVPTYMPALPVDPSGGSVCYRYQSDALTNSQEYKIRTASPEMTNDEIRAQPQLVDPANDGGSSTSCTVESGPGNATAWAYYTSGACAFN